MNDQHRRKVPRIEVHKLALLQLLELEESVVIRYNGNKRRQNQYT